LPCLEGKANKTPNKGGKDETKRENPTPSQKSKTQSESLGSIQTNHIPKATCDIVPTPCDIVALCPSGEDPITFTLSS
jgi:hypothetical protein